jgi:Sap, sulfolipid-1-addressing protein
MDLLEVLPLAFVMIAGPQLITAFLLATTARWASNSAAYAGGAAVSVTVVVTIGYLIARVSKGAAGHAHAGTADEVIDGVVLALMLFLIVHVYLNRRQSNPPKWMARLQRAEPRFAFMLGLALLGVFPSDIVTAIAVGLRLGHRGHPWWECLPFVALTLLLLALPALAVAAAREAGTRPAAQDKRLDDASRLGRQRDLCVFFAAITINSLVSGS